MAHLWKAEHLFCLILKLAPRTLCWSLPLRPLSTGRRTSLPYTQAPREVSEGIQQRGGHQRHSYRMESNAPRRSFPQIPKWCLSKYWSMGPLLSWSLQGRCCLNSGSCEPFSTSPTSVPLCRQGKDTKDEKPAISSDPPPSASSSVT